MNYSLQTLQAALQPEQWQSASQKLLAKMLAEFMYEEIINPAIVEEGEKTASYELSLPEGIAYRFQAQPRLFDSYHVFRDTMQRREGNEWFPATNPFQFVLDIHTAVGMTAETTAHLIKELSNTLLADAHIQTRQAETRLISPLSTMPI